MSFCSQCGNPLSDGAKFCARCGARAASIDPVAQEPVIVAPSIDEPTYRPPMAEPVPEAVPVQEPVWEEPAEQASVWEEPAYQEPVYQEPVYQEPIYQASAYVPPVAEAPAKPEKKRLFHKKPLGIGKKILVVFLCVLTFIFATATMTALCIRSTVTADNIVELVGGIKLSDMEATTIIRNADKDDSMAEWLHGELVKRGADWAKMSPDDVEVYLETFIIPFAEDKVGEFAKVLLTGNGKASITTEEVRELLEDSADYLEEEHDIHLTDENVDDLVNWIDSFGISEVANTRYLEKEYGDVLDMVRMVLSWAAVAVFGALTLVFLVLIWVTNKCLIRNLNSTGAIATSAGGMFAVFTVINLVFPGLLLTICGGIDLLYALVSMVITSGTVVILSTLGAGILLLLISRLLQSIKVKK